MQLNLGQLVGPKRRVVWLCCGAIAVQQLQAWNATKLKFQMQQQMAPPPPNLNFHSSSSSFSSSTTCAHNDPAVEAARTRIS